MFTVKEVQREIVLLLKEAQMYEKGSEEYERVAQDVRNLGEAVKALRPLDWVKLIEAGLFVALFVLLFIFNLDKVIESTPLRLLRNLMIRLQNPNDILKKLQDDKSFELSYFLQPLLQNNF